ncbi:hypothetical protein VCRA2114E365_160063 [Vibrio crassostreae]|nr:hypothetical protein VCRA2117O378_130062 [Vibrio crassostreae]CAK1769012.1 hypothetical protein VCRA2113O356_140062 [Vibrio crassostreae]CAK1778553.1 hypothetical protein VCRA2117O376_150064 [Vibrio crassostreae]CAK1778942.1 hypothetical protein VCRA2113O362_150052 [Vibrio crassostreae]CAK1778976.1 hypothetical protein VCRA2115O371_150065 [Vibrio crassostreae]
MPTKSFKTQKAASSDAASLNLAPLARLELATYGLTVRRSTN